MSNETGAWVKTQAGVLMNLVYARNILLRTDDEPSSTKYVRAEFGDGPATTLFETKDASEAQHIYEKITRALLHDSDLDLHASSQKRAGSVG